MSLFQRTVRTFAIIVAALLVAQVMQPYFNDTNLAMVYVIAVVVAALTLGVVPAVVTCLTSVALFDFVNIAPYFEFSLQALDYVFTLVVMLVTAVTVSLLAERLRAHAARSQESAARSAALFALSETLAHDRTEEDVIAILGEHLRRAFRASCSISPADVADGAGPAMSVRRLADGRSAAVLPIQQGGRIRYRATLVSSTQEFTAEEEALLRAMTRLAEQALARTALRQQVQEAASRVQEESLRSSILGAVSHDLRTPLAAIIGASSTLLESGGDIVDGVRLQLRQVIYEEAVHMQRMIENLLDLARIRSGDVRSGMAWHALEEIVASTLHACRRRGIAEHLVVDVPTDLPLIRCDATLLERVLTNLLENAVKHSPEGTQVTLTARTEGHTLVVDVSDAGPGIPEHLRDKVFTAFFRGSEKAGTGLGLTICRGIVEAHDGRIDILDTTGGGTTVRVRIPLPATSPSPPRDISSAGETR